MLIDSFLQNAGAVIGKGGKYIKALRTDVSTLVFSLHIRTLSKTMVGGAHMSVELGYILEYVLKPTEHLKIIIISVQEKKKKRFCGTKAVVLCMVNATHSTALFSKLKSICIFDTGLVHILLFSILLQHYENFKVTP